MSTTIAIIAIIAGVIGIIGSIVPGLPGPPLSWGGLLLLYLCGKEPMTMGFLLLWLAITVVVTIIDYFVPVYFTKLTGGSKYAGWGAMIGLFAGLIIPPVGMIVGSLLGAFVAEFIFAKKDTFTSLKSSLGAFLGFIFGTGIKIASSGVMMYYIVTYAF